MTAVLPNTSPLQDWLSWLESLDPSKIKLGLERAQSVWQRANIDKLAPVVVTVAGTNGKGSCVGFLETILCHAGYKVGAYTSPHIHRYNERVRINGKEISDQDLVNSFANVDKLRGETQLTYFEFGTLAAFDVFASNELDIVLLEVGLGGRLDAVNVIDTDVALVTSIDIDHVDWLGRDRESIGFEKAGIFRKGTPAVCADANPPASLVGHAKAHNVPLLILGRDYGFSEPAEGEQTWSWWIKDDDGELRLGELPIPGLGGGVQFVNAAGVLAVLRQLQNSLAMGPITLGAIHEGLAQTRVAGRYEILSERPTVIIDVAHNPQSARALADHLQLNPNSGRTLAVFGSMADKDMRGIVEPLVSHVDSWYLAAPSIERAASTSEMSRCLEVAGADSSEVFDSVQAAMAAAKQAARADDRVVVFGSFYTVAEATA